MRTVRASEAKGDDGRQHIKFFYKIMVGCRGFRLVRLENESGVCPMRDLIEIMFICFFGTWIIFMTHVCGTEHYWSGASIGKIFSSLSGLHQLSAKVRPCKDKVRSQFLLSKSKIWVYKCVRLMRIRKH